MENTSVSLLDQLRRSGQSDSWDRLLTLYGPLLRRWLFEYDVQASDADDLVQDVLLAVANDIKQFEHRGHVGSFRGWLKTILLNRLRKHWRRRDRKPGGFGGSEMDAKLAALEDPASEISLIWNQQHDQFVLRQLLQIVEPQFAPMTWTAFCRVALKAEKPAEVAQDLQISLNAVCLAKSRVLRRLRKEAEGLVESSSNFFAGS